VCIRRERGQGNETKGWSPPHPTTTHVGGDCVAEEAGGGMAPRQSSLRAFQYIARAFEVAGIPEVGAGREGGTHLRGATRGCVG